MGTAIDDSTAQPAVTAPDIQSVSDLFPYFDPWARNLVSLVANGQNFSERAYSDAEAFFGYSLSEVQKPRYAYSGDMHPTGHESYCIGPNLLGDCLVHRTPDSIWLDENNELLDDVKAFFALAESKGIKYIFHCKSTSGLLTREIEDYFSLPVELRGETVDPLTGRRSSPLLNPHRADYIFAREETRIKALSMGRARFERLGIKFEPEVSPAAISRNNVLAQRAQQRIEDVKKAREATSLVIIPVLQDAWNGQHYFFNARTGNFVQMVALDHLGDKKSEVSPDFRLRAIRSFIRQLSSGSGNKQSREELGEIAAMLLTGYTEFLKDMEELKSIEKSDLLKVIVTACSDSRMKLKAIVGNISSRLMVYCYRVVGGMLSGPDGKLTAAARIALSYAQDRNLAGLHTQHSVCGAMNAIHAVCSDPNGEGAKQPEAFKKLGQANKGLDFSVVSKGLTDADVKDTYAQGHGLSPASVSDCLGLEQLGRDRKAIDGVFPDNRILSSYLHVAECQNYIRSPQNSLLLPVPAVGTPRPQRNNSVLVRQQPAAKARTLVQ